MVILTVTICVYVYIYVYVYIIAIITKKILSIVYFFQKICCISDIYISKNYSYGVAVK